MEIKREFIPVISVSLLLLSVFAIGNLSYNIENLETGEEYIPEFPEQQEPNVSNRTILAADPGMLKLAFIGFIVTLVVIIVAGVAYAIYKGESLSDFLPIFEFLGGILAIAFIIGGVLFFHEISGFFEGFIRYFSFGEPAEGGGPTGPGGKVETTREFPIFFTIAFVAALIMAISLFMYHFLPSFREAVLSEERERAKKKRTLAKKVRRTIAGLESGEDFRTTILRCYSDLCFVLAFRGVLGRPSMTPREFERIAARKVGLSPRSIRTLTGVFEVARYSDHEILEGQRNAAVRSLKDIEAELEVS
ncbi:MAG: DUF4129 domain-containing protein [Thermoplasmata archaeon]|nr:DUF4129 domain-containing protein [Thermoplasmata archaeon]